MILPIVIVIIIVCSLNKNVTTSTNDTKFNHPNTSTFCCLSLKVGYSFSYKPQVNLMKSAAFSPIIIAGALVCAAIVDGIMLLSATLKLLIP